MTNIGSNIVLVLQKQVVTLLVSSTGTPYFFNDALQQNSRYSYSTSVADLKQNLALTMANVEYPIAEFVTSHIISHRIGCCKSLSYSLQWYGYGSEYNT